ncbi:hypothetical protein [Nonomuraea basaltis]|uniref:hypothetical protein n=1 Tax=Nonomuraea basaltis TaxID=2495887 RepID=UPI00110C6905|nr:hypothetical protein [Nonomuraea basaltis]TMR91270.1 hypothetical protein EJK15_50660 [Nonomuraea basaltis]
MSTLTTEQKQQLEAILERILGDYPINPDLATHVMANFAAEMDYWSGHDRLTIVYTGSREADRQRVHHDLTAIQTREASFHLLIGYNTETDQPRGGDRHAHEFAATSADVTAEYFPAPWRIPELEKAAGPYRNGFMIGLALGRGGRVGMLAHLRDGSTGSAGAAAFAEHAGIKVWRRPA